MGSTFFDVVAKSKNCQRTPLYHRRGIEILCPVDGNFFSPFFSSILLQIYKLHHSWGNEEVVNVTADFSSFSWNWKGFQLTIFTNTINCFYFFCPLTGMVTTVGLIWCTGLFWFDNWILYALYSLPASSLTSFKTSTRETIATLSKIRFCKTIPVAWSTKMYNLLVKLDDQRY